MPQIAQFAEYGDPDVLRVIDMPAPTAGQGQVRVAVRAAGVNPIDWKTVQGLMRDEIPLTLPTGVGSDVSGVVDQVGPGVSKFAVGDAVLGSSVTSSFAEYALAEPASLLRKPHGIRLGGGRIARWSRGHRSPLTQPHHRMVTKHHRGLIHQAQ